MTDAPQSRWFHVTPDRVVLGLLAVEGFLWLSERFHWFVFGGHKGWPLLICVATVAAAFVLMFLWFLAALVFRLRFQFSILSLLLLVVVVAIPCSWLATEMRAAKKQSDVVVEIKKAGGHVAYDWQFDLSGNTIPQWIPPGPPWLCRLLGSDLLMNVTEAGFDVSAAVSNADMEHLEGLPHLQRVDLGGTNVSDAQLEHLQGLSQLRLLLLGRTKVGDAGLEHLKGLTQLRSLWLIDTKVSDAGVKDLQKALPNLSIRR